LTYWADRRFRHGVRVAIVTGRAGVADRLNFIGLVRACKTLTLQVLTTAILEAVVTSFAWVLEDVRIFFFTIVAILARNTYSCHGMVLAVRAFLTRQTIIFSRLSKCIRIVSANRARVRLERALRAVITSWAWTIV